ncbi:zinc-binding dehydrogenase [Streptomonospora nanhaiensis]|uniref:NADPH:quinone reductase-like Zn-dependent oxidoreductase n=1 Tax=Streptomonospora nanhaiensis TaxID=1323731 RepID=A0A853BNL8_9ACTN|nr:zinc-binding dehydrogenase [Streptomonospora nanhaiensis]NYI97219.1 NADPH:quinone reductase-like Zn-dependent oxidoreductase [Streptomonospora nanhaiensis]
MRPTTGAPAQSGPGTAPVTPVADLNRWGRTAHPVPERMTAVVLTRHGGPEALEVRHDVPTPGLADDQVLVAVAAAGMNNTDVWSREGGYGTAGDPSAVGGWRGVPLDFPRVQGGDIAGRIVGVGARVDPARLGERVLVDGALYDSDSPHANAVGLLGSERDGGFAQFAAVEARRAHDVGASPLSDRELAALPIAYGTAVGMLERVGLAPGERVLVTGASGGVGLALVQLARARGCTVVAVTTADKRDQVAAAGADRVLERGAVPREHLDAPVDVVADVVGGPAFPDLVDALGEGGRLVTAGAIAGAEITLDIRRLYLHTRRIVGSAMWTPAHYDRLVEEARRGAFAPVIADTYPLAEIGAAQRAFAEKRFVGKLVLDVPPAAAG